jgi:hypothetical protein
MSATPAIIDGHIWPPRADPPTLAAFARQSAQDWRDFLRHRATEMRPGARLVVIGGASDPVGANGANGLMDMVNEALRDLIAANSLSADEYRRMTIPAYARTLAEFAEPFADGSAAGLRLLHRQLDILADPLWAQYRESGDLKAFADAYVGFVEATCEPSLFSSLTTGRTPEERQALVQRFRDGLRERIAANPQEASCAWRYLTMLIAKDV